MYFCKFSNKVYPNKIYQKHLMLKITQKKVRSSLRKYVGKISVFTCDGPIDCKHKLIPSGCSYLSYNHKDIPTYFHGHEMKPTERLQITGPKTDQNIFVIYGAELSQILLEFTPSGFYYLFQESPASYHNELVNLSQLSKFESTKRLSEQLGATNNTSEQIDLIQDFLIELAFHALPFCNYIEEALEIMHQNIGKILVNDIAGAVNKSERQLNRQFVKIVGIPPKVYLKLLQLHYVINLMNVKEISSFKEISYSANFYDQSHFDHRFKELLGITPNEFLVSKEHNALKYFTDW